MIQCAFRDASLAPPSVQKAQFIIGNVLIKTIQYIYFFLFPFVTPNLKKN